MKKGIAEVSGNQIRCFPKGVNTNPIAYSCRGDEDAGPRKINDLRTAPQSLFGCAAWSALVSSRSHLATGLGAEDRAPKLSVLV